MRIFSVFIFSSFFTITSAQDISGCMDSYAGNYNTDATLDDGSCTDYPDNGDHSLSFDGVDDYGYLPWNDQLDTYTVALWVRAHDLNQISYQAYFNNSSNANNGFQLDCNNSEEYRLFSSSGSIVLAPLDMEWAHVSVTSDGSTTSAYFNGELVETVNWLVTGWDQIVLGRNRSTNEPGNYNLDEINIWNTSKTSDEIQYVMNNELDGNEEGLLVYWKANAGEGDIVYDHTGNANHSTLYGATWIDGNPGWANIDIQPDSIDHLAYSGEVSSELFTISNNGDDDLDWTFSFNAQARNIAPFTLPENLNLYDQNNLLNEISTGPVIQSELQTIRNTSNRDPYNIWVYNNVNVANVIGGHESLTAVSGANLTINDYDVFFNIRNYDVNPEETLEWIYNGGTWVGEWVSNDYPINTWNIIEGNVSTGANGAGGNPVINDPGHWLVQNIDWDDVPVGTEPVQFMRNITIDDPDANVIVSLNHSSYGVVPLLVEKNYGEGTIILFNCDYQDAPSAVSDLIQKVAYYAAALAGEVEWLSVSDTSGTIAPGFSQDIELTFDATSLDTGSYVSEFFILSNDPDQPNISVPVDLEVDMYFPNISLSLDSFHVDLFLGDTVVHTLTIQNNGEADLNWTGNIPFSWVMLSSESGVVPVGGEQVIELMFHTNQWAVGSYASSFHVASNDEDEPELYIPLSLTIFENIEAPEFPDTSVYEDSSLVLLLPNLYPEYSIEYTVSSDTSSLNAYILSDSLILLPSENWSGFSSIQLILTVSDTMADTTEFLLEVISVNDSPILSTLRDTVMMEDSILSIPLEFSDVDNEDLLLSVSSSLNEFIYIEITDSLLHISSHPDFNGDSIFVEVSVTDNMERIVTSEDFMLTVQPQNDVPVALDEVFYMEEDGDTLSVVLEVTDGDSTDSEDDQQSLNFTVLNGFDHGYFDLGRSDAHLIYVPNENYFGQDSLQYIVTDDGVSGDRLDPLSDTAFVIINIMPMNDTPAIGTISDTSMNEDSFLQLPLYVVDIDNDSLSVSAFSSDSSHINVIIEDGIIHLNSYMNWNGSDTITVIASDNMGRAVDVEEFEILVLPVNDLPEIGNELEEVVGVGVYFEFHLFGYDIDMDSTFFLLDSSYDYPDWFSLEHNPDRLVGSANTDGMFHFPILLSDGQETVADTFRLSAHYFEPRISSISDIPNDQGERVYLTFQKSFFDQPEQPNQFYTLFRLDNLADSLVWISIGTITASGSDAYVAELSTLLDSTSLDNGLTEFKVIAFMNEGTFQSESSNGYSLDNLAPETPQDLIVTIVDEGIEVNWSSSSAEDFQFFNLDKSLAENFIDYETFIIEEHSYMDTEYESNQTYYYRLSAVDLSGNISDYSSIMGAIVLNLGKDLIPNEYALYQNYPNPFNPVTTIRYDLPIASDIIISVYDIQGRIVRTILSSYQEAGYNSVLWDATNDIGESVSAGMYLYLIQSNEFKQTRKMLLLK